MTRPPGLDTFLAALLATERTRVEQFAGLIWFLRNYGESEVPIMDALTALEAAGMPKQNRSRFLKNLGRSPDLVQGSQAGTIRLNPSRVSRLDDAFAAYGRRKILITDPFLPATQVPNSRRYLPAISDEMNGCYECGFYDCAAVMARRLVETLLIEVYVGTGRAAEIQQAGAFLMLDPLIAKFAQDTVIIKSRNLVKDLREIKSVGDNAAHSRTYLTSREDLDHIKLRFRRSVSELVMLAGL